MIFTLTFLLVFYCVGKLKRAALSVNEGNSEVPKEVEMFELVKEERNGKFEVEGDRKIESMCKCVGGFGENFKGIYGNRVLFKSNLIK